MNCICIDPAHVAKILPMAAPILREAMANGHGHYEDIEGSVLSGEKLLWLALDEQSIWAAAVTGLHTEHGHRFCCIWAVGGREKAKWMDFRPTIEQFARDEGCASVRVYGRRGWCKELPEYRLVHVVLEKVF